MVYFDQLFVLTLGPLLEVRNPRPISRYITVLPPGSPLYAGPADYIWMLSSMRKHLDAAVNFL